MGRRMAPVGVFNKDSGKKACKRYLIKRLKLAPHFYWVLKDRIFGKQTSRCSGH